MSDIERVHLENFETQVIERSFTIPVLVDFTATWCGPCRVLLPILSELATRASDQFLIVQVDTDEEQKLAGRYGIQSLPTLKLFQNGQVVEEILGVKSMGFLLDMIHRHMSD